MRTHRFVLALLGVKPAPFAQLPAQGQAVISRPCNDRVSARGKSAAARAGSRRNALLRAWATLFMLHPSNRAQSQLEWRSTIDMTKTKRSNGASLVKASITPSV